VVYFVNNLKKDGTYGDTIVKVDLFFLQTEKGNCYITEDPNLPLFSENVFGNIGEKIYY
jgi:hypothetical protein